MKHFDAHVPDEHTWPDAHAVPSAAGASAGQFVDAPPQTPAVSHAPVAARQVKLAAAVMVPHVPSARPVCAPRHDWQSVVEPPHAVLQHTPSTQFPLVQNPLDEQAAPLLCCRTKI
jgi:hypothetical protein